jgi:hypothetical protein
MPSRYRAAATPKEGICARIRPDLGAEVRQQAGARGVHQWWVLENALRLGLPLLPPPGQETLFAQSDEGAGRLDVTGMSRKTRWRGRPHVSLFAQVDPQLVRKLAREVSARDAHQWWVLENAVRLGLPLLPEPEQEVMLRSA